MDYTVREFRSNVKEALDKVKDGECVHIKRGKEVFELNKCVHAKLAETVKKVQRKEIYEDLVKHPMGDIFKSIAI